MKCTHFKWTVGWVLTNVDLCDHHHHQDVEHLRHPRKFPQALCGPTSPPPSQPQATADQLVVIISRIRVHTLVASSLSAMFGESSCYRVIGYLSFLIVLKYGYTTACPFTCRWIFGGFPVWGYYEQRCCEHSYISRVLTYTFISLG